MTIYQEWIAQYISFGRVRHYRSRNIHRYAYPIVDMLPDVSEVLKYIYQLSENIMNKGMKNV